MDPKCPYNDKQCPKIDEIQREIDDIKRTNKELIKYLYAIIGMIAVNWGITLW